MKYQVISLAVAACLLSSCGSNTTESTQPTAISQPVAASANKQELTQAVKALQKVDSAVSVGTNMINYTSQLTEAKTDVDSFLLKDSSSETAKKVSRVFDLHLAALNWWKCDVAQAESSLEEYTVNAKCRDGVLPSILALSPTIKEQAEAAIAKRQTTYKSDALDKSAVLQLIWQETAADTKALLKEVG